MAPQISIVFQQKWADLNNKFENSKRYEGDMEMVFSFMTDCFIFIFDEMNMLKALITNDQIKRNKAAIQQMGFLEEANNFSRRHTTTSRLELWIKKTMQHIESNAYMLTVQENLQNPEIEDTTCHRIIGWLLIRVICSLPVSQLFEFPVQHFSVEILESLIPTKLVNSIQFRRAEYPECLDLDTEEINILRVVNHNAAIFLSFFHMILELAKSYAPDLIKIENFMLNTEVLNVQVFASFLKNKTSYDTMDQLRFTQCFLFCLDQESFIYLRMKSAIERWWFRAVDYQEYNMPELDYMRSFAAACCIKLLKPRLEIFQKIVLIQKSVYKQLYVNATHNC